MQDFAYYIIAIYEQGISNPTNTIIAIPHAILPPEDFHYEIDDESLILRWSSPVLAHNQEIDTSFFLGYKILRDDVIIAEYLLETTFTDNNITDGKIIYKVIGVYKRGESLPATLEFQIVSDSEPCLPLLHTMLIGNFPNPFNPQTTIVFTLAYVSHITIDIYNIRGQRVRSLVSSYKDTGWHHVVWDGKDINGFSLSSGIYLYRFSTQEYSSIKRMMLLR
jgi:hypothetical protein